MNFGMSLIPVAASALNEVVQSVGGLLHGSGAFDVLLGRDNSPTDDLARSVASSGVASSGVAEQGPEPTELAHQVQHTAMQQRFDALCRSVHERLMEHLSQRGVDLSEPAVLSTDTLGRICETSGHWDRGIVEEVIYRDAALQRDLHQLFEQGEALRGILPNQHSSVSGAKGQLVVDEKVAIFQVP